MTDEPIKWHSDATAGDLPAMADLREHIKERDREIERLRAALVEVSCHAHDNMYHATGVDCAVCVAREALDE